MRDSLASVVGNWRRSAHHHELVEPAAKRISTPAGQRLSTILGAADVQKARNAHRLSVRKSGLPAEIADLPRESNEEKNNNSSGYSYTVWSDTEKWSLKSRNFARRVGWKRIVLIAAFIICAIVAIAVGIAVGVKKNPSSSASSDSSSDSTSNSQIPAGAETTHTDPADPDVKPTATGTLAPPSATPSNFPTGQHSIVTFLDTIQTNCTSNAAAWTCDPGTIFNSDPNKAVATFNWAITSSSSGKLQISSTGDNPSGISFKNADLEFLGQGTDAERYRFQFRATKTVTPSEGLTDESGDVECDFDDTSFTAFLYTKMARSYPDMEKGQPSGDPKYPVWPYAVRVEQIASSGADKPSCRKMSNGQAGDQIGENLSVEDASALCSCLYKNWRTPGKY